MFTLNFFGWGKKQKCWKTPDGKWLVVVWSYFHIFWCPVAFGVKWHLIEDEKANFNGSPTKLDEEGRIIAHIILKDRMVSSEKVKEVFPAQTLDLNIWERYGLIVIVIGISIINIWY